MRNTSLVFALIFATGLAAAAPFVRAEEPARQCQTPVGMGSTAADKCVRPISVIFIGSQSLDRDEFACRS